MFIKWSPSCYIISYLNCVYDNDMWCFLVYQILYCFCFSILKLIRVSFALHVARDSPLLSIKNCHEKEHLGIYRNRCKQCNAGFRNKRNLSAHMISKHRAEDLRLYCPLCNQPFTREDSLKNPDHPDHIWSHALKNDYPN